MSPTCYEEDGDVANFLVTSPRGSYKEVRKLATACSFVLEITEEFIVCGNFRPIGSLQTNFTKFTKLYIIIFYC